MKILILTFVVFIVFSNSYCQYFNFEWRTETMGHIDQVSFVKDDTQCTFRIKNSRSYSLQTELESVDCLKLAKLLGNFNFRIDNSSTIIDTTITYLETKFILDSMRIIADNDTFWIDALPIGNYYYDKDRKQCYLANISYIAFTDGTTFSGEYQNSTGTKKYEYYQSKMTKDDYDFNLFIGFLIKKYDTESKFIFINQKIERTKPFRKNNGT